MNKLLMVLLVSVCFIISCNVYKSPICSKQFITDENLEGYYYYYQKDSNLKLKTGLIQVTKGNNKGELIIEDLNSTQSKLSAYTCNIKGKKIIEVKLPNINEDNLYVSFLYNKNKNNLWLAKLDTSEDLLKIYNIPYQISSPNITRLDKISSLIKIKYEDFLIIENNKLEEPYKLIETLQPTQGLLLEKTDFIIF